MKPDRPIRKLLAEQFGERDGLDLIAIARTLEEEFGVELPREQVARLDSYGDLLQLVRDTVASGPDDPDDDDFAVSFVRARVVASGSDGRVSLVRVGWLTPDLIAAVADDVRHAPTGTWLEVLVPDDLSDAELGNLRQWLNPLASRHVSLEVRRAAEPRAKSVGPAATPRCDELTQGETTHASGDAAVGSRRTGTDLADPLEQRQLCFTQRRRSEQ